MRRTSSLNGSYWCWENLVMNIPAILATCVGVGAIATSLVHIHRWMVDRSLVSRRRHELVSAEELVRFVELGPRLAEASSSDSLASSAVAKAKKELERVLANLNKAFDETEHNLVPTTEVSLFRQWLLLYTLRGWRAGLAQFLFYSLIALMFFLSYSLGYDDTKYGFTWHAVGMEFQHPVDWLIWILLILVVLLVRYAAVVEHHWSAGIQEAPGPWAQMFLWYRPINTIDLMARLLFFICGFMLLLLATTLLFDIEWTAIESPYPNWFKLGSRLLLAWSACVAYFWSRAEYKAFKAGRPRPWFPHELRFLYAPSRIGEFAANLSFYVFACWLVVELYLARLPDLSSIVPPEDLEIATSSAIWGWFVSLVLLVFFPMFGAYRWGLALYRSRSE